MFVVTRLFGDHDEARKQATLDWFLGATVNSVRAAASRVMGENGAGADNGGNQVRHVGLHLLTKHAYAAPSVQEEIRSSYERMYNASAEGGLDELLVLNNHTQRMRRAVSSKNCGLVSVVRIDADDVFSPHAFQRIHQGYKEKNKANAKANNDDNNDIVVVTGMHSLPALSVHPPSAAPPSSSQQQLSPITDELRCSLNQEKRMPFLYSLGLAVTAPAPVWLSHFGGDARAIRHEHTKVLPSVRAEMLELNITTVENAVADLGLYMKTPLSGHYVFPQQKEKAANGKAGKAKDKADEDDDSKCDLSWLERNLGEETGQMVWNSRQYLPQLSAEQWCNNYFLSVKVPKNLQKKRSEICDKGGGGGGDGDKDKK